MVKYIKKIIKIGTVTFEKLHLAYFKKLVSKCMRRLLFICFTQHKMFVKNYCKVISKTLKMNPKQGLICFFSLLKTLVGLSWNNILRNPDIKAQALAVREELEINFLLTKIFLYIFYVEGKTISASISFGLMCNSFKIETLMPFGDSWKLSDNSRTP